MNLAIVIALLNGQEIAASVSLSKNFLAVCKIIHANQVQVIRQSVKTSMTTATI